MASVKKRTTKQNSSAHLWFSHIAETFNDSGLDMQATLTKRVGLRWTPEAVKECLFKVLAKAMYNKDSTTQLTSKEFTKVAEMLRDVIAKDYGLDIEYPSIETQQQGGTGMALAETSRQAYKSLKDLGDKQRVVYEAIKTLGRATNEQLADYLNWPIQSVTGRVNELGKYNMVAVDGLGKTKSGRSAKIWVIKDLNDSKLKVYGAAVPWMHSDD